MPRLHTVNRRTSDAPRCPGRSSSRAPGGRPKAARGFNVLGVLGTQQDPGPEYWSGGRMWSRQQASGHPSCPGVCIFLPWCWIQCGLACPCSILRSHCLPVPRPHAQHWPEPSSSSLEPASPAARGMCPIRGQALMSPLSSLWPRSSSRCSAARSPIL